MGFFFLFIYRRFSCCSSVMILKSCITVTLPSWKYHLMRWIKHFEHIFWAASVCCESSDRIKKTAKGEERKKGVKLVKFHMFRPSNFKKSHLKSRQNPKRLLKARGRTSRSVSWGSHMVLTWTSICKTAHCPIYSLFINSQPFYCSENTQRRERESKCQWKSS